jgi:hypothetical protein
VEITEGNAKVLKMLHACMPLIIKSLISRVMHIGFLSPLWPKITFANIFLIRGGKKSSNSKLTTLIVGDVEFAHYFANLVYSENHKIQALMKTAYCNISSIINQAKVDVIVVRADTTLSKFLSREGFLILPEINFAIDISSPFEKIFARMSRLRRRNINTIKKLKYSYKITREPQKLNIFYYKMYLPYTSKRCGKSAKLVSFFDVNQVFKKGGLLLVKLNGKYVSGILYDIFRNTVSACCLGIYEGKDQYLEEGTGQAALYFLVKWSKLQGYKEINYGMCKPFMNDGLFAYKRSWGMKLRPGGNLVTGIVATNFNTSVMEFLSENPMVFAESQGLSGLVFQKVEGTTEKVFPKSHHSYYTQGLSRIVVVSYSTKDSSSQSPNPSYQKRLTEKVNEKEVTPHFSMLWSKRACAQDIFKKVKALMG